MDLTVGIADKQLPNPVGVASGTFGYGEEYAGLVDLDRLGALYTKAVTGEPRAGNEIPRLIETPAGLLNSIGLANVGVDSFLEKKMTFLGSLSCPVIANVAGSTDDEYVGVVEKLEENTRIWGYEINVSCPNVKHGCLAFGTHPEQTELLTARLRRCTDKPLIVKLTPNVTDISSIARAAEAGGADGVSCINTLIGMAVDIYKKRPVLPGLTGGLSGPAIRPVGIASVYRVKKAVTIPVIGIGGIMCGEDALQYLLAGASAVQIGTANFLDPATPAKVLEKISDFCDKENLQTISDLHQWLPSWES